MNIFKGLVLRTLHTKRNGQSFKNVILESLNFSEGNLILFKVIFYTVSIPNSYLKLKVHSDVLCKYRKGNLRWDCIQIYNVVLCLKVAESRPRDSASDPFDTNEKIKPCASVISCLVEWTNQSRARSR